MISAFAEAPCARADRIGREVQRTRRHPQSARLLATEGAIVGRMPSAVNATSEAKPMRVDSRLESVGETLPLVRQVESLFFALWCSNWTVVQFDSRMHCSVTCHFHG
jgi:hypothetical protein